MNRDYLEAIVLGIVQGITEFLPISSDGHLSVARALLAGGGEPGPEPLEQIMVLHLGTLLSILLVYRRDLWGIWNQHRLCLMIVIATIPLVPVAYPPLKKFYSDLFEIPIVAGFGFLVTACFLWLADRTHVGTTTLNQLQAWQALVIGLFQSIAPLPGVSRSGSTISSALLMGLERSTAVTFSFLIAIPAIGGACVSTLKDLFKQGTHSRNYSALGLGFVVSFVVGCLALTALIRIVNRGKLSWFRNYCIVVGIITIVWQLISPTPRAAQSAQPPVSVRAIAPQNIAMFNRPFLLAHDGRYAPDPRADHSVGC